jgi:hypothetical protein
MRSPGCSVNFFYKFLRVALGLIKMESATGRLKGEDEDYLEVVVSKIL